MKNYLFHVLGCISIVSFVACTNDNEPPPPPSNPLVLNIEMDDTLKESAFTSAVLADFSRQKVEGKRMVNKFQVDKRELSITIENWAWQKPPNKALLEKTYGKYENNNDADQCKKIDNVWYCDLFNASYKIGSELYYVEQDDPNSTITLESFDTTAMLYSGSFKLKMYTILKSDSIVFTGELENIPYTIE